MLHNVIIDNCTERTDKTINTVRNTLKGIDIPEEDFKCLMEDMQNIESQMLMIRKNNVRLEKKNK